MEIRRDQTGNMSGTTTVKYVAALRLFYAALLFVLNLQPTSYLGALQIAGRFALSASFQKSYQYSNWA